MKTLKLSGTDSIEDSPFTRQDVTTSLPDVPFSGINILVLVPNVNTGQAYHRLQISYINLAQNSPNDFRYVECNQIDTATTEFLQQFQAVVFSCEISATGNNLWLIKRLKYLGIVVIMDLDDYWIFPPNHPNYIPYKRDNTGAKQLECLKNADYVTTPNKRLAQMIMQERKDLKCEYVQNAIDPKQPQFQPKPAYNDFIGIGWVGGSYHYNNLNLLRKAFEMLHADHKVKYEFESYVLGFSDQDKGGIYESYAKIFTCNGKYMDNFNAIKGEDTNNYAFAYNLFDIALAPLQNSVFNSCKSELKMIEAGFMQKAIITSNVEPYSLLATNKNSISITDGFANSALAWKNAMKRLILNENLVNDLAMQLYEDVKVKYHIDTANEIRAQLLKELVK